ncbi:MAG TPA: beta-propeller fold lactonase family protein, partial [Casimicrobiaceae bacterium]|nr:beta-propeller fold lactonase family protein [Casimicrobiaceae bacterium]
MIATVLSASTALSAFAAPFAYVSNEGSASVSVIDTATDKLTATFNVGGKPRGIALSPDRKRLYVSDQTGNAALIIDTSNGALLARIALGSSPEG